MCKQSTDGKLLVKQCLNAVGPFTRFDDICDRIDGEPWVVLFREDKNKAQDLQPIDNDVILVFCLVSDKKYPDLSYLGHRLVQRTMPCWKFSSIISKMAEIREEQTCEMFVGGGDCCKMDISHEVSSLEECGAYSGCSIFVKCSEFSPLWEQENSTRAVCGMQLDFDQDGKVAELEGSASTSNQQPRCTRVDNRRGRARCLHRCGCCLTNPRGEKFNCDNQKLQDD